MAHVSIAALVSILEQLHNEVAASFRRLCTAYPTLPLADPRICAAHNTRSCLTTAYLMAIFADDQLAETAWWKNRLDLTDRKLIEDELIPDYMAALTIIAAREPVSLFEANLRTLVRALDPSACGNGTADFMGSIVPWLLRQLRDSGADPVLDGEELELLELCAAFRNTIHNNGRYVNRSGGDRDITWQGITYTFEHGKAPSFMDWHFHRRRMSALIELNEAVMTTPLIAALAPIGLADGPG